MALATAIDSALNQPGPASDARTMGGHRQARRAIAAVLLLGATAGIYATEWLAFLWPVAAFPVVFAGIRSATNRKR